jgi:hypothetical protein
VVDPENVISQLTSQGYVKVQKAVQQSTFQLFSVEKQRVSGFFKLAQTETPEAINLRMQFDVLNTLYPELKPTWISTSDFVALGTPELRPANDLGFSQLEEIAASIQAKQTQLRKFVPETQTIFFLLETALKALNFFESNNSFGTNTVSDVRKSFFSLESMIPEIDTFICHGDLGNKNIFIHEGNYVLLDWEDSLWGFSQFDAIYWLTFFANMNKINSKNLTELGLPLDATRSVFMLVITLKEYLWQLKGSVGSKITPQQRLDSVLDLIK